MPFSSSPYAETESRRHNPMTTRCMVTSPHYLATQAGVHILRRGGTALDAAIAVAAVLERRGHVVERVPGFSDVMGHAGAILRREDGMLFGATDPRSDGLAAGY